MQPPPLPMFKPVDVRSCGLSKGCYRNPPKCSENCDIIVTWKKMDDVVEFELGALTSGWVAVGFSNDKKMVRNAVLYLFLFYLN